MPIAVSPIAEQVRHAAPQPLHLDEPQPLHLVEQAPVERLTGRVTWLSGDGRRGVLTGVGGTSLPFAVPEEAAETVTFAEGDLVSYEHAPAHPSAPAAGDVRSLRRRAADRARSAARVARPGPAV